MGKIKMADSKQGRLFIVSAPSGAGKTTLCRALREKYPDMLYSVSYTTRAPRAGEKNGVDYFFIGKEAFKKAIEAHGWAEWARVHDHFYATSAEFLNRGLSAGKDILLDIDVQGAVQIVTRYPESITIFIMPPSLEALKQRLESRGADRPAVIERRLINAKAEMAQKKMYRHVIVNDKLAEAVAELLSIVGRYRADKTGDKSS